MIRRTETHEGRRVRLEGSEGHYDVRDADSGELLGEVRSWEQRYNLRRVFVSRGWQAFARKGGRTLNVGRETHNGTHSGTYDLRADAIAALVRFIEGGNGWPT